jgi:hypothetical protein
LEANLAYWLPRLDECLSSEDAYHIQGWSPAEQAQWVLHPPPIQFPQCIGCVDGWYLRINKPTDFETAGHYYSQYKKYYALLFIVVVDRRGRIRFISPPRQPGHTSETSAFLCDRLPLHYQVLCTFAAWGLPY